MALALIAAACQTTISHAAVLVDRTGSGAATLPEFTSRGTYEVVYSYDRCAGGVPGMTLDALVGTNTTPVTLVQTPAITGSGTVAGQAVGTVTLKVVTRCQWKITVSG